MTAPCSRPFGALVAVEELSSRSMTESEVMIKEREPLNKLSYAARAERVFMVVGRYNGRAGGTVKWSTLLVWDQTFKLSKPALNC